MKELIMKYLLDTNEGKKALEKLSLALEIKFDQEFYEKKPYLVLL